MACVWYVSKYVAPKSLASGSRGFLIMREISRMGHKVVIITSDSNHLASPPVLHQSYELQQIDDLQLWWIRTLKFKIAKSLRRILSWLDFEWKLWRMPKGHLPKPDAIVVSSLSLLTILNGFLLRRRFHCRLIFEIRDIWPLTIVEEGGFSKWNPFVICLGFVERLGYKYSDVIVGTMPNLGEHVKHNLGQAKPVYCIPMGIDPLSIEQDEELPPDYVDSYIPKNKFIVVHAGTIGITNALETFLECASLMKDNSQVHFLIVGEGDLRQRYQEKYSSLPNLTFAPRVPKSMVQAVLSKCDLVYFSVHPSKVWRYGQSLNKVIDYMLSAKPIVASYSGYPSMIDEAGCGTYVASGDVRALRAEIERYFNMGAAERVAMGEKGRRWILSNRTYEKLARDYVRLLLKSA
jgi:glycosyltransferase involved in cell wall biosynthesis